MQHGDTDTVKLRVAVAVYQQKFSGQNGQKFFNREMFALHKDGSN